jgi:5-(carboxyamino)imidazole ribonucleotide synthase
MSSMTTPALTFPLKPGSTIGILGSGQLGRMLAMAAARLGLKCHVYADGPGPAFDVAAATTIAPYEDEAALAAFTSAVPVATYEFENIPLATVEFLAKRIPIRPGAKALAVAQDRLNEKTLARNLGFMTADFAAIDSLADLEKSVAKLGLPAIIKTRRFGYDGKGQAKILSAADIKPAHAAMRGQPAILEKFVDFQSEVSVIAVRGANGAFAAYDVTENVHRNHILHTATVPANLKPQAQAAGIAATKAMAEAVDYVGVLAVEFFALDMARQEALIVNEMAPRVHNSGHWTIDACITSQFENHIRAVAGWPLGSTARHSSAVTTNLIGTDHDNWAKLAAEPGAAPHLYGKHEARAGRKMGHVTRLSPK